MNELTAFAIALFLTSVILASFYHHVVRPVVVRSILFRLFAKRDELRRMSIVTHGSVNLENVAYLQDLLCKAIGLVPTLSFWKMGSFAVRSKVVNESHLSSQFTKTASPELIRLRKEAVTDVLCLLALNSPLVTFFAGLVISVFVLVGSFRKMFLFQTAESFVAQASPSY